MNNIDLFPDMTAYRIYKAKFPFEARDPTELSMLPDDQLIVEMCEDGSWPNESAWMRGILNFLTNSQEAAFDCGN